MRRTRKCNKSRAPEPHKTRKTFTSHPSDVSQFLSDHRIRIVRFQNKYGAMMFAATTLLYTLPDEILQKLSDVADRTDDAELMSSLIGIPRDFAQSITKHEVRNPNWTPFVELYIRQIFEGIEVDEDMFITFKGINVQEIITSAFGDIAYADQKLTVECYHSNRTLHEILGWYRERPKPSVFITNGFPLRDLIQKLPMKFTVNAIVNIDYKGEVHSIVLICLKDEQKIIRVCNHDVDMIKRTALDCRDSELRYTDLTKVNPTKVKKATVEVLCFPDLMDYDTEERYSKESRIEKEATRGRRETKRKDHKCRKSRSMTQRPSIRRKHRKIAETKSNTTITVYPKPNIKIEDIHVTTGKAKDEVHVYMIKNEKDYRIWSLVLENNAWFCKGRSIGKGCFNQSAGFKFGATDGQNKANLLKWIAAYHGKHGCYTNCAKGRPRKQATSSSLTSESG